MVTAVPGITPLASNADTQVVPDKATAINDSADALAASLLSTISPSHASAIVTVAQEEPLIFALIMAVVHAIHQGRRT